MTRRHGLTLVEVLAATVLLAMIAAACLPLLRSSMRALRDPPPAVELLDLSRLADRFVADPAGFGAEAPQDESIELGWPEHPDRSPVTVRRFTAGDEDAEWLTFTCDRWTVSRWVTVEADEP